MKLKLTDTYERLLLDVRKLIQEHIDLQTQFTNKKCKKCGERVEKDMVKLGLRFCGWCHNEKISRRDKRLEKARVDLERSLN